MNQTKVEIISPPSDRAIVDNLERVHGQMHGNEFAQVSINITPLAMGRLLTLARRGMAARQ